MDNFLSYDIFKTKIHNNEVICSYMPNFENKLVCCQTLTKKDKHYNKDNYAKRRCKKHLENRGYIKKAIKADPPVLDNPNKHIEDDGSLFLYNVQIAPQKKLQITPIQTAPNTTTITTTTITTNRIRPRPRQQIVPQRPQNTYWSNLMTLLDSVTGDTVFTEMNRPGQVNGFYDMPLANIPPSFFEPVQIQRNVPISNSEAVKEDDVEEDPDVNEENRCVICLCEKCSYVAVPCGHMILCESCAKAGVNNHLQGKCPKCRKDISTFTKVFI